MQARFHDLPMKFRSLFTTSEALHKFMMIRPTYASLIFADVFSSEGVLAEHNNHPAGAAPVLFSVSLPGFAKSIFAMDCIIVDKSTWENAWDSFFTSVRVGTGSPTTIEMVDTLVTITSNALGIKPTHSIDEEIATDPTAVKVECGEGGAQGALVVDSDLVVDSMAAAAGSVPEECDWVTWGPCCLNTLSHFCIKPGAHVRRSINDASSHKDVVVFDIAPEMLSSHLLHLIGVTITSHVYTWALSDGYANTLLLLGMPNGPNGPSFSIRANTAENFTNAQLRFAGDVTTTRTFMLMASCLCSIISLILI
jgi:hypothetical protein